jgi:ribonuclease D
MTQKDLYIQSPEQLQEFCTRLGTPDWIAIDTEFMREKTYFPKLCLIQIATHELVACIDPLRLQDLSPLLTILENPCITKVMHAARQDMEVLQPLGGDLPAPIFDTQLAATVLGYGDQVGYGNLVKTMLDIELDKAHTRADWSRRPLESAQLKYAADDVRYLCQVYQQQLKLLDEKGRRDWLNEDFARLTDPDTYANPPETAWLRVKGAKRLKPRQLAIVQALAAWREQQAITADRPRRWILQDDVLLELARHMPKNIQAMERIRGLEAATLKRHGQTLLPIIKAASELPKEQWPVLELPPRLSTEQEAIVDTMMAILRHQCQQHDISPTVIASRRGLESLVLGKRDSPVLHGWRATIAGNELQALLRGERALQVSNNQLQLVPVQVPTQAPTEGAVQVPTEGAVQAPADTPV